MGLAILRWRRRLIAPLVAHSGLRRLAALALTPVRRARRRRDRELIEQSGLFDAEWYRRHYADRLAPDGDPLAHFMAAGRYLPLAPGPAFDPWRYTDANAEVNALHIDPLSHYLRFGRQAGREILPLPPEPDPDPAATEAAANRALIEQSGLFDAEWYRRRYLAAGSSEDPLGHYLATGAAAGHDPGPLFDATLYLSIHPDLAEFDDTPLLHFLKSGRQSRLVAYGVHEARDDRPTFPTEPIQIASQPLERPRVVVVLHMYYVELIEEFCGYLANLPFRFSLVVTVTEPDHVGIVQRTVAARGLAADLHIKCCPNRGRNFGPFLCFYRNFIRTHEVMLHIHSKRSLYTGGEQVRWRDHLLQGLLGSPALVNGILDRFTEEPDLGVIYPGTAPNMPYWAHHWLSNGHLVQSLFDRFGITSPPPQGYFDYPVGSMFWARVDALDKLLAQPWQLEDFPPEAGQTDGTLMHGLERMILILARDAGYGALELDGPTGTQRRNWGARNLDQCRDLTLDALRHRITAARTIAFDLFDTLAMRHCLTPHAVHQLVEAEIAARHAGAADFHARRLAAEAEARAALVPPGAGDVDLDQIYHHFAADEVWTGVVIAEAKAAEIAWELRLLTPRRAVVTALREAHDQGKRLILVSDTYKPRAVIDRILDKIGVAGLFDAVYLSCEQGRRKDRGDLWQLVLERETATPLLHIGDNEQSDIQNTLARGIPHFHVLTAANLMALRRLSDHDRGPGALARDILLGPVAERLFNSPFADGPLHGRLDRPLLLDRANDVGFVIFGPLLFAFMAWLTRHPVVPQLAHLYFASREGYFLLRLYQAIRTHAGRSDLPAASYFLCSRQVALLAAYGRDGDPAELIAGSWGFTGSIADLLRHRTGVRLDPALDLGRTAIRLPDDHDFVLATLTALAPDLESAARPARQRFLAYCRATGFTRSAPIGFVDVGYSGTMQQAIQRAIGPGDTASGETAADIIGLYVGLRRSAVDVEKTGGQAYGAFADHFDAAPDQAELHDYSLLLEAFLSAPHGQLAGFESTGDGPTADGVEPWFWPGGAAQAQFARIAAMQQGALDYCLAVLERFGPIALDIDYGTALPQRMINRLHHRLFRIAPDLMDALAVEDWFYGNGEIRVADRMPVAAPEQAELEATSP